MMAQPRRRGERAAVEHGPGGDSGRSIDEKLVFWYQDNMKKIERVQTGVRLERRILKVAKATAEMLDMPLGELIEGVLLHSFEGAQPFGPETLTRIAQLRSAYDLDLSAADSHKLVERRDEA